MRGGRVRVRKELALIPIICVNSFVVDAALDCGFGISAISSVPYAFNQVLPDISPGNLDLPVPGIVGVHSVWGEKKHPHSLSVQLCGRLSVRDCRGRPRILDRYSADGSVLENFVFCRQLPPALRGSRHRKQEPDAPGAHGSVSQGILCFDREAGIPG